MKAKTTTNIVRAYSYTFHKIVACYREVVICICGLVEIKNLRTMRPRKYSIVRTIFIKI